VGADAVAVARGVHARGAVEAVAVEEGDGGDFEFLGAGDEVFGLGGAFEEREGAGGVEFYVMCNFLRSHIFSGAKAPFLLLRVRHD
jgi:hypothetical protein